MRDARGQIDRIGGIDFRIGQRTTPGIIDHADVVIVLMDQQVIVSADDRDQWQARIGAGVDDDQMRAARDTAVEAAGVSAQSCRHAGAECSVSRLHIRERRVFDVRHLDKLWPAIRAGDHIGNVFANR